MGILVLGLGNLLMRDDSLGCRIVAELEQNYRFEGKVEIIDGGTLGFDLLPRLEGIDKLLIVDALQMGAVAGELFRLDGEDVPRAFAHKLSVHQMGLQDLLTVADLLGCLPRQLVVWGVQAESVEMGMELSPRVAAAVAPLVDAIRNELQSWGCCSEKKNLSAAI